MEMMELIYSRLLEEEEVNPLLLFEWDKSTIKYVLENKSKVYHVIRSYTKNMISVTSMDIEDIYSYLLEYLGKANDYENGIVGRHGSEVTLESYVYTSILFCCKRFKKETYMREKDIIKDTFVDDDGDYNDIFDKIPDERSLEPFDGAGFNLNKHLKSIGYLRYKYKHDIFLFLYIRLLTMGKNDDTLYRKALDVFGITRRALNELERAFSIDEEIRQLIKALSGYKAEEAANILEKYVYNAKTIRRAVDEIMQAKT